MLSAIFAILYSAIFSLSALSTTRSIVFFLPTRPCFLSDLVLFPSIYNFELLFKNLYSGRAFFPVPGAIANADPVMVSDDEFELLCALIAKKLSHSAVCVQQ